MPSNNHQTELPDNDDQDTSLRAYLTLQEMLMSYRHHKPKCIIIENSEEKAKKMYNTHCTQSKALLGSNFSRIRYFYCDKNKITEIADFLTKSDNLHVLCIEADVFINHYESMAVSIMSEWEIMKKNDPIEILRKTDTITYLMFEEERTYNDKILNALFYFTNYVWILHNKHNIRNINTTTLDDPSLFKKEYKNVFTMLSPMTWSQEAPF